VIVGNDQGVVDSFAEGVELVEGSAMVSMVVQLWLATSPRAVLPPQVQSPAQPGTAIRPLLHTVPLPEYSRVPTQQARWPLPPQDEVGVTQVPDENSMPPPQTQNAPPAELQAPFN
jgi:hypothetical protein